MASGSTASPKAGNSGLHWTEEENALLVADYFDMLDARLAGLPLGKAERRRALIRAGVGRSEDSIHRKQQNISAALLQLGVQPLPGYDRSVHFQASLLEQIERQMTSVRMQAYDRAPPVPPIWDAADAPYCFVNRPNSRPLSDGGGTRLGQMARKFVPVARDFRNRSLGLAGEAFVMEVERRRLTSLGQGALLRELRWVSAEDGDGLGYDIRSFDETGSERLIEGKTTRGSAATPFFLTRNELDVSRTQGAWMLYRVHEFGPSPKIFVASPPLGERLTLTPEMWRAAPAPTS